ncbi:hypothetical protein [Archangium violaceum]|uniref:Uncharacterized protein n=1 Tax=Archangium violaceum Cb vi76 TaxID=1406225 RepID=A0A084SH01_9BACT|nr:hypothetical protein [Archangium violaceum]KFA87736.1 hypothetical protein Q664_45865 [Archangium violaceum Cb vi76]
MTEKKPPRLSVVKGEGKTRPPEASPASDAAARRSAEEQRVWKDVARARSAMRRVSRAIGKVADAEALLVEAHAEMPYRHQENGEPHAQARAMFEAMSVLYQARAALLRVDGVMIEAARLVLREEEALASPRRKPKPKPPRK